VRDLEDFTGKKLGVPCKPCSAKASSMRHHQADAAPPASEPPTAVGSDAVQLHKIGSPWLVAEADLLAHGVVILEGWRRDMVTCVRAGGKYRTLTDGDPCDLHVPMLRVSKIDLVAVQQKIPLVRTCVAFGGCGQLRPVKDFPGGKMVGLCNTCLGAPTGETHGDEGDMTDITPGRVRGFLVQKAKGLWFMGDNVRDCEPEFGAWVNTQVLDQRVRNMCKLTPGGGFIKGGQIEMFADRLVRKRFPDLQYEAECTGCKNVLAYDEFAQCGKSDDELPLYRRDCRVCTAKARRVEEYACNSVW
jgi:hypothetical protein